MSSHFSLLKNESCNLSVPSADSVDHSAVLSQFVLCLVPSLGFSAEEVPSSSPFLSLIMSVCCLDLLSWCLLTTQAARVAILLASLDNFTRLCSQHVLMNTSTITAVCALPLPSHLFRLICWFLMHTLLNG